jgi:Rhodopirellula transposase DDE domain
MPRCLKSSANCWSPRQWASEGSRCGVAVGLEEPRQAGSGAVCDGASDCQEPHRQVAGLLQYRRQVNRQTLEDRRNPDRDAVDLIAPTTTKTGLIVRCELDGRSYPKGSNVSDDEMASINIKGDAFHPEWNHTISPRVPPSSDKCWASPKDRIALDSMSHVILLRDMHVLTNL